MPEGKVIEGIRPESLELEFKVIYKDGEVLCQNYAKGEENGEKHFGHIDQERLQKFTLVDAQGEEQFGIDVDNQCVTIGDVKFYVEFPRDKEGNPVKGKLVYFRRIRNDFAPDGIVTTVRYALGLQANIDGVNFQQYLFVNDDGTFTLSQKK